MAKYVLVGGAWLGGWCWQPIARLLRNQGHDAYPATLTGLGERSHLAGPEVNLETHITDVVSLIEFEDLSDVVLLGHRATRGSLSRAQPTRSPSVSPSSSTWTADRFPTASPSSTSSLARSGGCWSCPRVTGRCSPGPMIWPRC
jgi:hypothetical protein